jgi:hypothetical protein
VDWSLLVCRCEIVLPCLSMRLAYSSLQWNGKQTKLHGDLAERSVDGGHSGSECNLPTPEALFASFVVDADAATFAVIRFALQNTQIAAIDCRNSGGCAAVMQFAMVDGVLVADTVRR